MLLHQTKKISFFVLRFSLLLPTVDFKFFFIYYLKNLFAFTVKFFFVEFWKIMCLFQNFIALLTCIADKRQLNTLWTNFKFQKKLLYVLFLPSCCTSSLMSKDFVRLLPRLPVAHSLLYESTCYFDFEFVAKESKANYV